MQNQNDVLVSLLLTLNRFIHCSGVYIVDFEQLNAGQEEALTWLLFIISQLNGSQAVLEVFLILIMYHSKLEMLLVDEKQRDLLIVEAVFSWGYGRKLKH